MHLRGLAISVLTAKYPERYKELVTECKVARPYAKNHWQTARYHLAREYSEEFNKLVDNSFKEAGLK